MEGVAELKSRLVYWEGEIRQRLDNVCRHFVEVLRQLFVDTFPYERVNSDVAEFPGLLPNFFHV